MPEVVLQPVFDGISIDKYTRLRLNAWAVPADLEIHLCARTHLLNGELSMLCEDYHLTGAAALDEFFIVPSPGLLSSANLYVIDGVSAYGDIFVQLSMLHGKSEFDMAHRLLIQGYIGGTVMRGFPCSPCEPNI